MNRDSDSQLVKDLRQLPLHSTNMSKLCKKGCEVAETDKFCKDHGELQKCKDGHFIIAATKTCKESGDAPDLGEVVTNNATNTQGTSQVDLKALLEGLSGQITNGMAESLAKVLSSANSAGKAPPDFIKDPKDFDQWKTDIRRWADMGGCPKKNQGSTILMSIPKDHKFKKIMENELAEKVKNDEDATEEIIKFVEKILACSDPLEKFHLFVNFFNKRREQGQTILEYTAEWETLWSQLTAKGVKIDDEMLAWWYFSTLGLTVQDLRNIFTQINMLKAQPNSNKSMLEYAKDAARNHEAIDNLDKAKVHTTLVSNETSDTFLVNPGKNGLNQYGFWRRCFNCRDTCKHDKKKTCQCPCSSHLSPDCPLPKKDFTKKGGGKFPFKRKFGDKSGDVEEKADEADTKDDKSVKKNKPELTGYTESFMRDLGVTMDYCMFSSSDDQIKKSSPRKNNKKSQQGSRKSKPFYKKRKSPKKKRIVNADHICLMAFENREAEEFRPFIDTACPTTVAGKEFVKKLIMAYPQELRQKLKVEKSDRMYKFGGGEKRQSLGRINFPVRLEDTEGRSHNVGITTEVVHTDFPLLFGGNSIEKAGLNMRFAKKTLQFENLPGLEETKFPIRREDSGHYSFQLFPAVEKIVQNNSTEAKIGEVNNEVNITLHSEVMRWDQEEISGLLEIISCVDTIYSAVPKTEVETYISSQARGFDKQTKMLSRKDVEKIHHYFGHIRPDKVREIVRNSGRLTDEVDKYIDDLEDCDACRLHKNKVPRPKVAFPRAKDFNELVTVDLKENKKYATAPRYILYIVDSFSRFTRATFIKDKRAETVANALWEQWLELFGKMEIIHSDLGREFVNEEMSAFCDKFDIKQTTTAAQSAHQNGRCERNHALCDRMLDKMCTADPTLSPEMALKHAIMAHNTMLNHKGFSPCQMVFNQNPTMPTVLTSGPPGLEEVKLTAKVAKNLSTMQSAKEAFVQCEADRTIAETLRSRLYVSEGQKVEPGTWVYYKQHGRLWKGPVKIHSVDGKRLYAVRGGKLQCINRDDVILSRFEEQMMREGATYTRIPVDQANHQIKKIPDGKDESQNTAENLEHEEEASAPENDGCPAAATPVGDNCTVAPSQPNNSHNATTVPITNEPDAINEHNSEMESPTVEEDDNVASAPSVSPDEPEMESPAVEEVDINAPSFSQGNSQTSNANLVQCKECASVMDLKSVVAHNRKTHSIVGKGRNLSIPANEEALQFYQERRQEKIKPKEKPISFKSQDMVAVKDAEGTRLYEIINRAGKVNAKGGKNKDAWFVRNIITGQERKLHTTGLQLSIVGKITEKTDENVTFQNAAGNRITKPVKEFYRFLNKDLELPENEDVTEQENDDHNENSIQESTTEPEENMNSIEDGESQEQVEKENQSSTDEPEPTADGSSECIQEAVPLPVPEREATNSEDPKIDDETTADTMESNADEVFVATLPRFRHSEPESMKAKMKELEDFKTYNVYIEVEKPKDKNILGTQWVITEKDPVNDEPVKRKARMCIMGNQEKNIEMIPTESPTVAKSSIRLLLAEAARNEDWYIRVSDVTRAFLQTSEIEREVYVRAPKEAGLPSNRVWLLKRPAYGLVDASRGFYINQATKLVEFGMEVCKMDPAFFFYHSDGSTALSEVRKLSGMVATHVDDSLTAGDAKYRNDIEGPMTEEFDYGSHDNLPFRYVGLNMTRLEDGISLDQDHYIQNLAIPDISCLNSLRADDQLFNQSDFRSAVAKLQMISITSRPDLCYDTKTLSRLYGRATKKDYQKMIKLFKKVKSDTTKMIYKDLGDLKDWVIIVYSDASLKKMPDTVSSCGARVIIIVNKLTNAAAVIMWKSKQLKRVVHSSMAAEAMSCEEAISEIYQLRHMLRQMHGKQADKIPAISIVDCQDLVDSVHSLRPVEDKRLMGTIVEIKQAIVLDNTIQELRHVEKTKQVADGLTKPGASCQELLRILHTGTHQVPGGCEVKKSENVHAKTWVKPGVQLSSDGQFSVGSSVITTNEDQNDDMKQIEDDA